MRYLIVGLIWALTGQLAFAGEETARIVVDTQNVKVTVNSGKICGPLKLGIVNGVAAIDLPTKNDYIIAIGNCNSIGNNNVTCNSPGPNR